MYLLPINFREVTTWASNVTLSVAYPLAGSRKEMWLAQCPIALLAELQIGEDLVSLSKTVHPWLPSSS